MNAEKMPWALLPITVAAWAGFFVHNIADLPGQTILDAESLYPTLLTVLFLALTFLPRTRVLGVWTLLVWAGINLVGGILSVLPLPFLPFEPEQSIKHYLFHVVYAAAQIPLILITIAWLVKRRHQHEDQRVNQAEPK